MKKNITWNSCLGIFFLLFGSFFLYLDVLELWQQKSVFPFTSIFYLLVGSYLLLRELIIKYKALERVFAFIVLMLLIGMVLSDMGVLSGIQIAMNDLMICSTLMVLDSDTIGKMRKEKTYAKN